MAVWFIQEKSVWRRTETAPGFAPAVVEPTAAGGLVLLAPPNAPIAVNGAPLLTGIHLLQHRDEIAADGALAYYSSEVLPQAVSFPGPVVKCGRCRGAISEGAAAVKCACGVWYHHDDPPCFEYGEEPVCVACRRSTRLDGSGLWSPQEEEAAEW